MRDNLDQFFSTELARITQETDARVERAANWFADVLRQRIPRSMKDRKKHGHIADRIQVLKPEDKQLTRTVKVPHPWGFREFGTVHQTPDPVVRRAFIENEQRLVQMISGETE